MSRRHAFPVLALMLAPVPAAAAPDSEGTVEDSATILPVERERDTRMTVSVRIAGQGPFRFLVDTGAQSTVIARSLLYRLALTPSGSATLVGMASSAPVETVEIDGLEFAGREINGLVAPLLDDANIGADGIIGLDSLQDLRVTMDLRQDTLAVSASRDRAADRGYEIIVRARPKRGQLVITRAKLDGVATAVIIDTGSQLSIGNRALQTRLRARAREALVSRDINGALVESELGYARKLEVDALTMADIPIAFADSPVFAALGLADRPAVILGMRNLRLFDRVVVDFTSRRILFDLPANAAKR